MNKNSGRISLLLVVCMIPGATEGALHGQLFPDPYQGQTSRYKHIFPILGNGRLILLLSAYMVNTRGTCKFVGQKEALEVAGRGQWGAQLLWGEGRRGDCQRCWWAAGKWAPVFQWEGMFREILVGGEIRTALTLPSKNFKSSKIL